MESKPSSRRETVLAVGLGLLALLTLETPFLFRPQTIAGNDFIGGDQTLALWIDDHLSRGQMLYRDVLSLYGPLPAYAYHAWALLFGNSPQSFEQMQALGLAVTALAAWGLVRRILPAGQAALFVGLAVFPSLFSGITWVTYLDFERLAWLFVALAWRPVGRDGTGRLLAVGGGMGAMVLIKFGGGVMAFIAWVLTDLCFYYRSPGGLVRRWFWMGVGFALVEAAWLGVVFLWLPPQVAFDVAWPAYQLQAYATFVAPDERWPWSWKNLGFFGGIQLAPLVAFLLVLPTLFFAVKSPLPEPEELPRRAPFVFLGLVFLVAFGLYYKLVLATFNGAWSLLLGSAWLLYRPDFPRLLRVAVFVLLLPGCFVCLRGQWWPREEKARPVALAKGTLWLTEPLATRAEKVRDVVESLRAQRDPADRGVMILPVSGGWAHFNDWPTMNRFEWWLNGQVRPYDQLALCASLAHVAAVLLEHPSGAPETPQTDPATWAEAPRFSQETRAAFVRYLEPPIRIDDRCWVFPVRAVPADR